MTQIKVNLKDVNKLYETLEDKAKSMPKDSILIFRVGKNHVGFIENKYIRRIKKNELVLYIREYNSSAKRIHGIIMKLKDKFFEFLLNTKGYEGYQDLNAAQCIISTMKVVRSEFRYSSMDEITFGGKTYDKKPKNEFPMKVSKYPFSNMSAVMLKNINEGMLDKYQIIGPAINGKKLLTEVECKDQLYLLVYRNGDKAALSVIQMDKNRKLLQDAYKDACDAPIFHSSFALDNNLFFRSLKIRKISKYFRMSMVSAYPIELL